MNTEETDAMRMLDARLARLFADLDTRPGFEERLAAAIATLDAGQATRMREETRLRIEQAYAREKAAAGRAARLDALVLGMAGLAGGLAAWLYGPSLWRMLEPALAHVDPGVVGLAALPIAAGALWAVLRLFGLDLEALAGPRGGLRL